MFPARKRSRTDGPSFAAMASMASEYHRLIKLPGVPTPIFRVEADSATVVVETQETKEAILRAKAIINAPSHQFPTKIALLKAQTELKGDLAVLEQRIDFALKHRTLILQEYQRVSGILVFSGDNPNAVGPAAPNMQPNGIINHEGDGDAIMSA
jgi:hypothetical protein